MVRTRSAVRCEAAPVPSVGVRVLRGAVDVGVDDLLRLTALAYEGAPIFNPDSLRLQRTLAPDDPLVRRLLSALGELASGRLVGPAVVLHSLAGCERQPMHTDYDPEDVRRCACKPLGVLLALQDETALLRPGGRVELAAGDVVVFDGDAPHAGAEYTEANTRVHLYLDSPGVHRPTNTTYLWEADTDRAGTE